MEYWIKANGYSLYEVSNLGRIKTFNWKGSGRTKIMKPAKDASGYLRTVLKSDKGVSKTIKVHRVILNSFNPNKDKHLYEVNHKNGIKDDNRIENLEWLTPRENKRHAYENGLHYVLKGEEIGTSKLNEDQVREIREKYKPRVYTRAMLSKEYNVTQATIKDIIYRRTWKHLN